MVTDPISDLLVRLRNGFRRQHEVVIVPASKLKREILRVLQAEGFIDGVEAGTEEGGHPVLKVQLRYVGEGQPMITGMERISKPGRRVYVGTKDIPRVRNGIGMAILSTSKGIMTDQASRKAGLGGEVLCAVW
ncbi:MAG TPA: 30S ribosomal protein S8 [Nitrospira sp.]|nr:30S ribosomal protein S8 [Nitrospira sp.]